MTMMENIDMICSVCGETSSQPILLSTNSSGYSDLDTRPPEMQRSTMETWVYECPHCGYVSNNLGNELEIPEEFLKSEGYVSYDGLDFKSNLAKKFYRNHLISKESGDIISSFVNLRSCAWACDDIQDPLAIDIRKLLIDITNRLIEMDDEAKTNLIVMKADFLRRAGEFDKLIEEYENITLGDELLDGIIQLQLEKAHEKDDKCYTLKEVYR